MTRKFFPLLAAALLAAGCGQLPTVSADGLTLGQADNALGARQLKGGKMGPGGDKGGPMGPHGDKGGPGGHGGPLGGLFAGVELTADQQAQLAALMEKHKPAAPTEADAADRQAKGEAMKAKHEALKTALTAEVFDEAAFRVAIAPPADARPHRAPDPQLLVEARAILTADQLAAAIEKLKAAPTPEPRADHAKGDRPDPTAKLAEKLTLTADQQAKLSALTAAFEAGKPAHDPAAHRAELIAFLETGDASKLTAPPAPPAPPIDAMVAFVGSLDATQRATLAEGPFLLGPGGKGGPGGPGFPGGPGGHGMKGGPGGFPGGFPGGHEGGPGRGMGR